MERKLGEVFTYKGKTYQVVKNTVLCDGCAFLKNSACSWLQIILGNCGRAQRTDHEEVIFKEINNMEIKGNTLTIEIPEGMEIDLKNSDLTNGIVKFKKKRITYESVEDALELGKNCKSIIINESNASKLVALSRLMNIAKYYNKDWKPDWKDRNKNKYYIIYNNSDNAYAIDYNCIYTYHSIYFKNKEDVLEVINNPNFKDILDTIYKN